MPPLQELLDGDDRFRLAMKTAKPSAVAREFAAIAKTTYNQEEIARLEKRLCEVLFEMQGPMAMAEFLQEFHKRYP